MKKQLTKAQEEWNNNKDFRNYVLRVMAKFGIAKAVKSDIEYLYKKYSTSN